MEKGRGLKTVFFLGRYGVVIVGAERLVRDQRNLWESWELSIALQSPSLVPHHVSHPYFCWRPVLQELISRSVKMYVTSLNSAQ